MEKTFESFDKFQRREFGSSLTKIVLDATLVAEAANVVSLNAKFGSGKTTFLDMWGQQLKALGHDVVRINAWESDYCKDPILPISIAISDSISEKSAKGVLVKNVLAAAAGASTFAGDAFIQIGKQIIKSTTGLEADKLVEAFTDNGNALFDAFREKQALYDRLKKELGAYLGQLKNKPLIVLVDELDRARPDYSVEFLETIKHIFSVSGLCFVLAVDRDQLKSSVKKAFGADIDFDNYYRRFITREITLPNLRGINLYPFLENLAKNYFSETEGAKPILAVKTADKNEFIKTIADLCAGFQLTPRQIEYFFRVFSHYILTPDQRTARTPWIAASAFLVGLSIKNETDYHDLGQGLCGVKKITDIAGSYRLRHDHGVSALVFAFAMNEANASAIAANYGGGATELYRMVSDFPHIDGRSAFERIYRKLEVCRGILDEDRLPNY